jgi:SAM-dependent methyltransferase
MPCDGPDCDTPVMDGSRHGDRPAFAPGTYGESFADVYDDWYADVSDIAGTVRAVAASAGGGLVVELGAGTGRLAVPLAEAGCRVVALDVSAPMLGRLAERLGRSDETPPVLPLVADMTEPALRPGCASVVLVAFNTLFNVTDPDAQQRAVDRAADLLAPGGRFVVEAFVPPDPDDAPRSDVSARSVEVDRVVLVVALRDPAAQTITGQHVELTEAGGVRLRPWKVRYLTPPQLDAAAAAAGLVLEHRWADWDGTPFAEHSAQHVSVYRRP